MSISINELIDDYQEKNHDLELFVECEHTNSDGTKAKKYMQINNSYFLPGTDEQDPNIIVLTTISPLIDKYVLLQGKN